MKDLTKIKAPLGLLGKKTRKALRAHHEADETIQCYSVFGWMDCEPDWTEYHVYRAKPTALDLTPSGDGCADDTDAVRSILDEPLTGRAYASPLNHAGCDTPAAIFAAVKEWQEALATSEGQRVGSARGLIYTAAIKALRSLKVPE